MTHLATSRDEFHSSLSDERMQAMDFLNEVMSRYPQAISFAPGAPNSRFEEGFDVNRYYKRFLHHLISERGETASSATAQVLQYGPSAGIINDLVSKALRSAGIADVSANEIVITVGAQEALALALRAVIRDKNDVLAVTVPCYAGVTGAAKLLDIDIAEVPEGSDGPDLEILEAQAEALFKTGRQMRALYVAPDFANPSGTFMTPAGRNALLERTAVLGIRVIEDTAYTFTTEHAESSPSLLMRDKTASVIQLGTFSKIAFPGLRVGYLATKDTLSEGDGHVALAKRISSAKSMLTVNTSPLAQAIIGGMLLEHGGAQGLSESRSSFYRDNLASLLSELDHQLAHFRDCSRQVRWSQPQGGFFVRLDIPVAADDHLLKLSAERFGVIWTPMRYFFLSDAGDKQLRLSCSYLSHSDMKEGVRRLAALLRHVLGGALA